MFPFHGRALARRRSLLLAALLLAAPAVAQPDGSPERELGLAEAARLAVTAQPLLLGLDAQARAARESAVAARQLPDPQLRFGVSDLPVNGSDAGAFDRDSDTQVQLALMQELPRAGKRRLQGELELREAARLGAEQHLAERTIARDAALAWLQLWREQQALGLAQASLDEARTQTQLAEIALRTGSASQAEYLSTRQEADRLQDALQAAEQGVEHARNALSRWIGEAAYRPVAATLPPMPELPPADTVLARVRSHPHLAGAAVQVAAAQTGAQLARAAYRPDWRVELGYGYRPAYSEMVTLQVGVDLPLFAARRQDRGLAAALAREEAAQAAVEDAQRHLLSEARLNWQDYTRLQLRLQDYERQLLPRAGARTTAALAGWRSGRNALREVLDARRATLDTQLARLELQHDLAKHYLELDWLGAFDDAATEHSHE